MFYVLNGVNRWPTKPKQQKGVLSSTIFSPCKQLIELQEQSNPQSNSQRRARDRWQATIDTKGVTANANAIAIAKASRNDNLQPWRFMCPVPSLLSSWVFTPFLFYFLCISVIWFDPFGHHDHFEYDFMVVGDFSLHSCTACVLHV